MTINRYAKMDEAATDADKYDHSDVMASQIEFKGAMRECRKRVQERMTPKTEADK